MADQDDVVRLLDNEAKKRREEVNVKASRPLPKCIRSIESTNVAYTVDPNILPFSLIKPDRLVSLFQERFSLKVDRSQETLLEIQDYGKDGSKMTDCEIMKFFLDRPVPKIILREGAYPTGTNSYIPINYLAFSRENVVAEVIGISEVAEQVIAEAFAIFWEAAGYQRRWSDKETQENVRLVQYGTATNVELGQTAENLINPNLRLFLDEEMRNSKGIASSMIEHSSWDGFLPNSKVVSSWSFDKLVLHVHVFETLSGRSDTAAIELNTLSKGDRGRGVVGLSTALKFDKHIAFAEKLCLLVGEERKK